MNAQEPALKHRSDEVEGSLRSDSLVGSFFHGTWDRQWQGLVVAEPAPGVYLVETFSWLGGSSTGQHLVRLEEMFEWTFYDTADWMRNESSSMQTRWKVAKETANEAD